jgi:hypothetical protein
VISLITVVVATVGSVRADTIVGSISLVGTPSTFSDGTVGGMNIIAQYSADLSKTCLKGDVIHWMQLVTTNKVLGAGFSKNLSFIDPIPNQPIGSGQKGNATPFYDITVNKVADFADQTKWLREGTGTFWGDRPQNLLTAGFFSFSVQTILVATSAASPKSLLMLGGFSWGYTIGADQKTVSLLPIKGLSFSDGLATSFNTALMNDGFPTGKDAYTVSQAICDKTPVKVNFTPEPGTIVLAVLGVPGLLATSARRRRLAA